MKEGPDREDLDRQMIRKNKNESRWLRMKRKCADKAQVTALRTALEPFVGFLVFLEAGRELDGDPRLEDTAFVLSYMGNGGSAMVTVKQFRDAKAALSSTPAPAVPDTINNMEGVTGQINAPSATLPDTTTAIMEAARELLDGDDKSEEPWFYKRALPSVLNLILKFEAHDRALQASKAEKRIKWCI